MSSSLDECTKHVTVACFRLKAFHGHGSQLHELITQEHRLAAGVQFQNVDVLLQGYQDQAMDLVNLKINRFGGLTRTRLARDLCLHLGIAMTIDDRDFEGGPGHWKVSFRGAKGRTQV